MEQKTLTPELLAALERLPERRRNAVQELRLRQGSCVKAVFPWGEEVLMGEDAPIFVTDRLLRELLDRATGFSPYALRLEETGLYLPLENGGRMGLCGEAVVREGKLQGLRHVSSMSIRLARQYPGIAGEAAQRLTAGGRVQSALIVSPPGKGKTTFLRDLIRCVSDRGYRVSVVDERRELAAARDGVPQLDLGQSTDVLSGCPKAQGMELMIRVMNPQVLAVDELSGAQELRAAEKAAGCGIALLATAHGESVSSLLSRPGYGALLRSGAFAWGVTLREYGRAEMERLGCYAEDHGGVSGGRRVADVRLGGPAGNAAAGEAPAAIPAGTGADAGGDGAAYAPCGRAV